MREPDTSVATSPGRGDTQGSNGSSEVLRAILERRSEIQDSWVRLQLANLSDRARVNEAETVATCSALLDELIRAASDSGGFDLGSPSFAELVELLRGFSEDRARRGSSPTDTALVIFSLREALVTALGESLESRPDALLRETNALNALVDGLGLLTFSAFVAARESVILDQQKELLELSTPVVSLWDGIVAVPLIGTLDSTRTQMVMENLLQAVVDDRASVAIIDITGVPVVDTVVAQHLIKTVQATRLMGAEAIISGIRPHIAQTVVHLGIEMSGIVTKATLAEALRAALSLTGVTLERRSSVT